MKVETIVENVTNPTVIFTKANEGAEYYVSVLTSSGRQRVGKLYWEHVTLNLRALVYETIETDTRKKE